MSLQTRPRMPSESVPFIAPDLPSRCTWSASEGIKQKDPHTHQAFDPNSPKILNSVLEQIGRTPLVRLNNLAKYYGLDCELLAKCEYFNAGGSVKDRIGLRMIEDAEREGKIAPGWTIIEPTSGNTGIGLALAAAVKGYKCIIVMPEKMSNEKVNVLHALGAEIVRTPTSARFDAPNSHICVAQKLNAQMPNSIILDQYRNAGNPLAHYDTTGEEIVYQTDGKVDMVVLGAGTGGTVTGIGRLIKDKVPQCIVVGVDPVGSILAEPEHLNKSDTDFYEVEGIGYDFIPTVLDRSVIDKWIKIEDKQALEMARNLIRLEGLLCGGSSGTAMSAAVKVARTLKAGQRCVVLLPDGVRNYMTKFLDDKWMEKRNFNYPGRLPSKNPDYFQNPIADILKGMNVKTIVASEKCITAINLMKENGYDQLPVVDSNVLLGMVTVSEIMAKISGGTVELNSTLDKVILSKFPFIINTGNIGDLIDQLGSDSYVAVVDQNPEKGNASISGIVTHIDIINYLTTINEAI